jgi:hypothetical protein
VRGFTQGGEDREMTGIEHVGLEPGEEVRIRHLGDRLQVEVYSHDHKARADVTKAAEFRVVRMPAMLRLKGRGH